MSYKLVLITICLALLSISFASAAPDLVFDRVVTDGTVLSIDGVSHTVRVGDRNNSLVRLTSAKNETLFLEEGECYRVNYDEFCYDEYDENRRIVGNFTNYRPIIEVDRDISETKIQLGEQTSVRVTFENTGGSVVSDFQFTERVPSYLDILNVSGCNFDGQLITMNAKLDADEVETCSYTMQGRTGGKQSYFGKITTLKVRSADVEAVPQATIEVEEPFKFNFTLSKYNLEAFQPFVLTINIENTERATDEVNLTIKPLKVYLDDFAVSKTYYEDMTTFQRSDYVDFTADVEGETTISQRIELIPQTLENTTLKIRINYSFEEEGVDPEEKSFEVEIPIGIKFFNLSCDYVVIDEAGNNLISLFELNNTLPNLDVGELSLRLINENNYLDLKDLSYSINGDFSFPNTGSAKSIRRNDEILFATANFFFSDLNPRNYSARARVRYSPREGDLFTSICNTNFFVPRPKTLEVQKDLVFVTQEVDGVKKEVSRIVMNISNVFFDGIKPITYSETFPSYFFTNVDFSETLAIDEGKTIQLSYDFIIPDEYAPVNPKKEPVTSLFVMNFNGVEVVVNKTIEVDVAKIISRQKNISLESIIEDKVLALKQAEPPVVINNSAQINQTIIIESTYSPFLPYFSAAMLAILFFLVIIIFRSRIKLFFTRFKRVSQIKKFEKEKKELTKYFSIVKNATSDTKKHLRSLEEDVKKSQSDLKKFEKELDSLIKKQEKNKKSLESNIKKQQSKYQSISSRRNLLDQQLQQTQQAIADSQSQIQQSKTDVEQAKVLLEQKTNAVKELEKQIISEQEHLKRLDSRSQTIEKKFDSIEEKDKEIIRLKKSQIEDKIKELDDNRKLLKDEENLIEHPVEDNK